MRWTQHLFSSSLLRVLTPAAPSPARIESRTEQIREAMLAMLDDETVPSEAAVARRIRHARDVECLWYLRGDVMAVLADARGESEARLRVSGITALFRGLMPAALHAPSR